MSADPDMTFEHRLGESGPVVQFRFGSVRFWQRYAKRQRELQNVKGDELLDALADLLNSAIEGDVDVAEHLTIAGLMELAYELPTLASVSLLQKKSLQSPSPSPAKSCAKDAETESASMLPPNGSPQPSSALPAVGGDVVCVTTTDGGS